MAVAQYLAAGVVAPVVQDPAQRNNVGALRIWSLQEIRARAREAARQARSCDVFGGDLTDRRQVRDDALDVREPASDLRRDSAHAASDIHNTMERLEIEARGNLLALNYTLCVHQRAEPPQAGRIAVDGCERVRRVCPRRRYPLRRILADGIRKELPEVKEGTGYPNQRRQVDRRLRRAVIA